MNTTDCLNNNEISKALENGDIDVSLSSTSWDLSFNANGTNFTGTREDTNTDYLTVTDGTNTEKWYIKYDSYTPAGAKYDLKMKDLITNTSNYQFDACINRIDVSGVELSAFGGSSGVTGVSNEYIYCLGGDIKCGDVDASLVTGDSWGGGKTYRATCDDNSTPTCNPKTTADRTNPLVIHGNKYDGTDVTTAFEFMGDKNFTGPYNYVPIEERTDGYISVRPSDSEAFFTQTPCVLYDTSSNCTDYLIKLDETADETTNDTTNDTTDETTTTEEPDENSNRIKCLADNGAEIGDNVCCNQKGVVQNTIYNCPSEFPKCIGYKCGENWGYCASSGSEVGEYTEDETTTAAPE